MNNFVGNVVRALVPILVGLLVSLGVRLGIHVNTPEATVVLTGLVTAAYATLAHAVEAAFPEVGKWLVTVGLFPKATEKAKISG